jgi:hypothetical protein
MVTYNIVYKKSTDVDSLINKLIEMDVRIINTFSSINVLVVSASDDSFSSLDEIELIEEDVQITTSPETYWHKLRIVSNTLPMVAAYEPMNSGENQTVYVVDSGINITIGEFEDAVSENRIINLYSYNENFDDENGHGTSITSLIVGKTIGVSPQCIIKNVKIPLGQSTHISTILSAFDAVLSNHLETPFDVKVVNCSWTIPKSLVLDTKLIELQENGLVVVAAAGNTIQDANNFSPVGLDTILGVGASDSFDRVIAWESGIGSNWGPEVDIFAPGIDVTVATADGQLAEMSGTSLSAAITSGVVLQYIHRYPEKTAFQIQEEVIARAITDVLFRNESIYSDTPNRLLYTNRSYAMNPMGGYFSTKKTEILEIPIELQSPYDTLEFYTGNYTGNTTILPWEFVELEKITDSKYKLIINAADISVGKYRVKLLVNGQKNEEKFSRSAAFTIGVYEHNETELITNDEVYIQVIDDDMVVVIAATTCFTDADCAKFSQYCCRSSYFAVTCYCAYICVYSCDDSEL